jgi:hypothetical protein
MLGNTGLLQMKLTLKAAVELFIRCHPLENVSAELTFTTVSFGQEFSNFLNPAECKLHSCPLHEHASYEYRDQHKKVPWAVTSRLQLRPTPTPAASDGPMQIAQSALSQAFPLVCFCTSRDCMQPAHLRLPVAAPFAGVVIDPMPAPVGADAGVVGLFRLMHESYAEVLKLAIRSPDPESANAAEVDQAAKKLVFYAANTCAYALLGLASALRALGYGGGPNERMG